MNAYTFSVFFRHIFKCLLEYLDTKDNFKRNCGIIVSPSYNRNQLQMASLLSLNNRNGLFFFPHKSTFFHTWGKNNFLFLILNRIHIGKIYNQLFYDSQKIFLKSLFFFSISCSIIFSTPTI